jgi:hypothetical protein
VSKLRLGPVAEDKPAKLTIELRGDLLRMLGEYAKAHAAQQGLAQPLAAERLIPPMLEHFMMSDRGFSKRQG